MTKRKITLDDHTPVVELQAMPNGGGSDITLKKDITQIHSALARILALRPVTWRWKVAQTNNRREHGFIAQEVEDILPELVSVDSWDDGTRRKFLSTKEMIPYLVVAIQEQQKQIDELKERLK